MYLSAYLMQIGRQSPTPFVMCPERGLLSFWWNLRWSVTKPRVTGPLIIDCLRRLFNTNIDDFHIRINLVYNEILLVE